MKRWMALLLSLFLWLTGCGAAPPPAGEEPKAAEPAFVRAVWMPYMEVEPFLSGGDPALCRQAIADAMEDCVSRGINTVYFHVRANSDAYYASSVYPPHPLAVALLEKGFDPLTVAVEEAHARGLALHAWVNPYRIGAEVSRARTEEIFEVSGRYYYVPSAESTHTLVVNGVRELVNGYAIDGVHFDDYFYPSAAVTAESPAPFEQEAYGRYREEGGTSSVADWRRQKVSALMAAVYAVCHGRDGCVFGVSPSYDIDRVREEQYADAAEWIRTRGYVDYLCPQLYVGLSHQHAPFEREAARWRTLPRDESVALYAGLALYKTGLPDDTYAGSGGAEWAQGGDIIARQAVLVRDSGWDGMALYSHLSFRADGERDAAVVQAETEALLALWAE